MKFSKRSIDALKGVHPNMVKVMTAAIQNSPVDFTVVIGVRTQAEQMALYAKGRTAPGAKVTNADGVKNKSNHQPKSDGYGHAVDIYPFVNGSVDVNDKGKNLNAIASHVLKTAKELGIGVTWGGHFKSLVDKPHFELK